MNQSRMRPEMVRLYGHHYKEQKRESNTERLQSNMEVMCMFCAFDMRLMVLVQTSQLHVKMF